MAHTVVITSSVKLTTQESQAIVAALKLGAADQITYVVDHALIAGLKVSIDGKTVDLSAKRQLEDLEK